MKVATAVCFVRSDPPTPRGTAPAPVAGAGRPPPGCTELLAVSDRIVHVVTKYLQPRMNNAPPHGSRLTSCTTPGMDGIGCAGSNPQPLRGLSGPRPRPSPTSSKNGWLLCEERMQLVCQLRNPTGLGRTRIRRSGIICLWRLLHTAHTNGHWRPGQSSEHGRDMAG